MTNLLTVKNRAASLVMAIFISIPTANALESSALLYQQSSYGYSADRWQTHTTRLDIELNQALEKSNFTALFRLKTDLESELNSPSTPDNYASLNRPRYHREHFAGALRELYWERQIDNTFWRIGKQQVVWGEADGVKLVDLVNPQSYQEFILPSSDDSRIPVWMLNIEHSLNQETNIQVLWVPDASTHEIAPAGSPFRITSALQVPQQSSSQDVRLVSPSAPKRIIKDSDFGLKLSRFWNGWDVTLNYLYHTIDEPVFETRIDGSDVSVVGDYRRSHMLGGTASSAFDDWTLRVELAFESDRYHRNRQTQSGISKANQWGSVIGADFQGWSDQFLSLQWYQSQINGKVDGLIKAQQEDTLTLLWEVSMLNDTLTLSLQQLYSVDHRDGLSRPKLSYNLFSNLDVFTSVDHFFGSQDGLYGQFGDSDRITIGFELGLD
jgi:Protein of unknown function (DUF1302)